MRSLLLAVSLFTGVAGCGRTADPVVTAPAAATSSQAQAIATPATPANLTLDQTQHTICPHQWSCDATGTFYVSKPACLAACTGSACFSDFNCRGNCICP